MAAFPDAQLLVNHLPWPHTPFAPSQVQWTLRSRITPYYRSCNSGCIYYDVCVRVYVCTCVCKDVCVLVPMGSDEPFLFVFGNSKHSLYLYMYNALDNNNAWYNGDISECPSSSALYSSSRRPVSPSPSCMFRLFHQCLRYCSLSLYNIL